ncbi:glycine cleavage system protein R [Desertihabitans aurantiacus]|uniref:glycine cleavage system protein R n=1 Tax=Desertihabitans aurantiacus TaxID=2282477 RepID=UPI000DF7292A|nr:ACT domain-containing protein [Desertihabitans aurantiacus]
MTDLLAVTVIGSDRPGIVADVTAALAGLEANLEDSTMTLLRGQFAMVVLVHTSAPVAAVEQALAPVTADGTLGVDVRPVADVDSQPVLGADHILHVNGADRPGIVAGITASLAAHGVNVVGLSTRLAGELYVLTAEVVLPDGVDELAVRADLDRAAQACGVHVRLVPVETDEL